MTRRMNCIGGLVAAAILLAAWKFASWPAKPLPEQTPRLVSKPATATPIGTPEFIEPTRVASTQSNPVAAPGTATVTNSIALNERTLIGSKWKRDGFALEFGADGKLLIGGRERAQWRVEGSRIRLYRNETGEEHWLDIVGGKLILEGRGGGRGQGI